MANGGPPNENTPLTAEQFRKEMQSLVQSIQDRQKDLTLSNNASGIFFIVLGLAFLVAAYVALERGVHTSFSLLEASSGAISHGSARRPHARGLFRQHRHKADIPGCC